MLYLQIALFVSVAIGIILIIISLMAFSSEKNNSSTYFEASNTIKAIETSINEMEATMNEFEEMSKIVFKEIDDKYQELLFLYSMIDERKTEVMKMYSGGPPPQPQTQQNQQTDLPQKPEQPLEQPAVKQEPLLNNPKFNDIIRLKDEGLSVSEIAKNLEMGQGEVKLMLELGKAR